jgi:hypothetical protein
MGRNINRSLEKDAAHDGEFVAAWLNSADGWGYSRESQERLKSLVMQLNAMSEKALHGKNIEKDELNAINVELERFPWVVRLAGFQPSGAPVFFQKALTSKKGHTWLEMIIQIVLAGLLDRLRRCAHCGSWFFAKKPKGIYCSTRCRQARFRSTPEYKTMNREYQRKHYQRWHSIGAARGKNWRKEKQNAKKR